MEVNLSVYGIQLFKENQSFVLVVKNKQFILLTVQCCVVIGGFSVGTYGSGNTVTSHN